MVLYPPITFAIRASVCVLLFRINTKRICYWIIWVNLIVGAICCITFFFILLFQCSPLNYFWRQVYGESGHCYNRSIVTTSTSVYSVLSALSDWCLGLLPIAILWSVQINLRTKVVIAALLSLGMMYAMQILSLSLPSLKSHPFQCWYCSHCAHHLHDTATARSALPIRGNVGQSLPDSSRFS